MLMLYNRYGCVQTVGNNLLIFLSLPLSTKVASIESSNVIVAKTLRAFSNPAEGKAGDIRAYQLFGCATGP